MIKTILYILFCSKIMEILQAPTAKCKLPAFVPNCYIQVTKDFLVMAALNQVQHRHPLSLRDSASSAE